MTKILIEFLKICLIKCFKKNKTVLLVCGVHLVANENNYYDASHATYRPTHNTFQSYVSCLIGQNIPNPPCAMVANTLPIGVLPQRGIRIK